MISNATARDKRLSYAARGLLCYLLSHDGKWETRRQNLINNSPAGRTVVQSLVKELLEFRYMRRVKAHVKGRIAYVTSVYDRPYG